MRRTFLFCCSFLMGFMAQAQRLVLPGDYPDPSVVKIGDTYWASATTSNWAPAYPLLYSRDLVSWKQRGYVFDSLPDWADYYFWAPEITYENGKVYIYYSAHKKGGNLCVGIASADRPEGPYRDHGPIICQEVGSIDAFPMRDENGKLHMIWKEDANSVNKPTPIWISELNEERTALVGEKKELFRNNAPWEANLVEGVSMIRHGDYFYAFYAAAGCCGRGCTYASGIARSKSLMGPWEKYNRNPILADEGRWKCPGHGTPIERDGRYYFLYHAYDTATNVYTGRQGLLAEFRFTPDGWIEIVKNEGPDVLPEAETEDRFRGGTLEDPWQWSVFQPARYRQRRGELELQALTSVSGAYIGQKNTGGNYEATVLLRTRKTDAAAGIGAVGDDQNVVQALWQDGQLRVLSVREGKTTEVATLPVAAGKKLYLRMQVRNGKDIRFFYRSGGNTFQPLNAGPVEGSFLPPWDRAVRIGLFSKGEAGRKAVFDKFSVDYR